MPVVPYKQTVELAPPLHIPRLLIAAVFVATIAAAALGGFSEGALVSRIVRAVFFVAAFNYMVVSIYDFYEHARLEHVVTGKWLAWVAVPFGESINHMLTGVTVVSMLLYVGPVDANNLDFKAWITLFGPLVFLALGWRDEIVFHRRRADHREDIMHTTAHLAAGAMFAALYAMRCAISV